MNKLFYTKGIGCQMYVQYDVNSETFKIIYENEKGTEEVIDEVRNINYLIETFDFWCKFTGIISTPLKSSQVEKHLTTLSRCAG